MPEQPPTYDYIIAGAGCAGLSLLLRLLDSGAAEGKKILLVDRGPKLANDRTWCFWEKGTGFFETLVTKSWEELEFHSAAGGRRFGIAPYRYKMIRGIDFYRHCFSVLEKFPQVTLRYGVVTQMQEGQGSCSLRLDGEEIRAAYIFNSILLRPLPREGGHHFLLQHFKGWVLESPVPAFHAGVATLMDFRVSQQEGASFVYVMPFSATRALVEYTLFSPAVLQPEQYDQALRDYCRDFLQLQNYQVLEQETGQIPMTNFRFAPSRGRIISIGTAGGQTKASSGYTFQFIQKRTAAIAKALLKTGSPLTRQGLTPARFRFYDAVLLHILAGRQLPGDLIFSRLFARSDPRKIFRFLDNESSPLEELAIISTLPTLPFTRAAIAELFFR